MKKEVNCTPASPVVSQRLDTNRTPESSLEHLDGPKLEIPATPTELQFPELDLGREPTYDEIYAFCVKYQGQWVKIPVPQGDDRPYEVQGHFIKILEMALRHRNKRDLRSWPRKHPKGYKVSIPKSFGEDRECVLARLIAKE